MIDKNQKMVVVDVETTTLSPHQDHGTVYSLAAGFVENQKLIEIVSWEIQTELSFQCRLVMKRLRNLSQVPEQTWRGEDIRVVALKVKEKLSEFFGDSYAKSWKLCAYNVPFEKLFLSQSPWNIIGPAWVYDIMLKVMDIMGPAGALQKLGWKPSFKWPRLESETLPFFNITNEFPHSAAGDVQAEVEVMLKLFEMTED